MIEMLNIDCMEYLATQPDKSSDLAIVDPPYFDGPNKLGFYGGRCSKTGVDRGGYKKLGVWKIPDQAYFDELFRVSKEQIIWGWNYYPVMNVGPGRIIWDKLNGLSTFSDCEIAYASMIDSVRLFPYMWNGMMQGSTANGRIQEGNKKLNEKRIHPTQKPVHLYKWLLTKYAEKGFRILDTHGGSFSSAIACHYFGCDMTICEIDPDYFKAGKERFERETKQLAMF